ncbi:hypothetical protein DOTSEDRAFT_30380 [Lecanosticta acicola]|uniref:BZIP domain-containing protein n=1 Tax=Lecanosticta acicola TaxID=111012 RepID=A0AAI8Z4K8_9PEZI|nr:hypothetical protein DOTSEDRAFT_30380 [Lecanosticta acicola]
MAAFAHSTFEASPDLHHYAPRLLDTRPVIPSSPSTTAFTQQTWPSPSAAPPRQTPQPVFTQDFDLFQPTAPQPAPSRRAPSLDPTLPPSFNTANTAAFQANHNLNSAQTNEIDTRLNRPTTRPPVPLFHSNSTGNLGNQQYQQPNTDITSFAMGGGGNSHPLFSPASSSLTMPADINVAYNGTFGDLSSAGDADLFNFNGSYDFQLMDSADSFTAPNDGSANAGTISPKDLLNDSLPPSTSFTNLTTPGSTVLETPDDYQTSPLFNDSMVAEQAGWYSLFPEDSNDAPAAPLMKRSSSSQIIVHPGGESNHRKRSSTAASPTFSPVVKHSQVAGVGARKRDKPLPPIVVDEADPIALKRARNTAAARKSRAKKVAERDDLETTIADLQAQVDFWKTKAHEFGYTE